jgi:hypothetical protein
MNIVWTPDPIYIVNLILCIIILIFGIVGQRRSGKSYPLYIGIAFGLFGISHLATLLGLKDAFPTILIIIRTCAYLLVAFALYLTAYKSK